MAIFTGDDNANSYSAFPDNIYERNYFYLYVGNDYAIGGDLFDHMDGGSGDDYLSGGYGDDSIGGGADNDVIYGGSGADDISGGQWNKLSFRGHR